MDKSNRTQVKVKGTRFLFAKRNLVPFGVLFLFLPFAQAATLSGKVTVKGTVPENPLIKMNADPICQGLHSEEVRDQKIVLGPGQTLKNVFVYVKDGVSLAGETPKAPAVLDQKGCMYEPHVLGLQTKQPLSILNSDSTLHNVHALGKANPEFNLGMPVQGMKFEKTFSNPEVMMKFKCDVHPWMSAYIGVLPHPFFSVTKEEGKFEITGLSPGEYTFEAWHETYGVLTKSVKIINASEAYPLDFEYSATTITDETSGLSVKAQAPKPLKAYDDSAALDRAKPKKSWWLPESLSTFSDKIDFIFYVILAITGVIFFGVQGTLIVFLIRYRAREGAQSYYTHGNTRIEIIWTVIPSLILIVLAFMGQTVWQDVKMDLPKTDPLRVRIKAEQFAWNIEYPGDDGKFDTPDDIKTINQLHIPVGKPVVATLTSIEKEDKPAVLHSFFLPEFRLKQDAVPGMGIDIWFEARKTGRYEIACAEFCGLGHYRMRGFLSIHSPEGYTSWLKEQGSA